MKPILQHSRELQPDCGPHTVLLNGHDPCEPLEQGGHRVSFPRLSQRSQSTIQGPNVDRATRPGRTWLERTSLASAPPIAGIGDVHAFWNDETWRRFFILFILCLNWHLRPGSQATTRSSRNSEWPRTLRPPRPIPVGGILSRCKKLRDVATFAVGSCCA